MRCAVVGCKNYNDKNTNRISNKRKISFFNFPKDESVCKKWVSFSGRQDQFNTTFARICSDHFDNNCLLVNTTLAQYGIKQRTMLKPNSVPSLPSIKLPHQSKKDDTRKQRLDKRELKTQPDRMVQTQSGSPLVVSAPAIFKSHFAQPPYFTGHDYIIGDLQTSKVEEQLVYHTQQNSTDKEQPIDTVFIENDCTSTDLRTVCRFCLTKCKDTVRIPWDEWEHSNLSLLYEKIVNVKLQISDQCSELYCHNCSRRLHDTFQSIQIFREANDFWQRHLSDSQEHIEPIEEVKIEEFDYDDADCTADYLESVADDVIFVEEPITIVDDITKLEISKVKKNEEIEWMCDDDFTRDFSYPEPIAPEVMETDCNQERDVFNCDLCVKVYKTARGLTEHKNAIHETMNSYCQICNKRMSTAYGLRQHMRNQHGPNQNLKCKICNHISKNLVNLKVHQLIHNRSWKTMTPCDECGKIFLDRRRMMLHKNNVHGPHVECICTVCGKALRNQTRLSVHMLTHDPVKPMCEHCQKSFSSKKSIIEHMNVVHKQGTPHICEQCGKEFRNRFAGRKHSEKCTGKCMPYDPTKRDERKLTMNCVLCNHAFAALETLQRHYLNIHDSKQCETVCLQCNKLLDTPQALEDHKQNVHENLQCTICKKNCLSAISFRIHMEGHGSGKQRFKCDICGGSYARFEYLKMHHRRRHTKERPFKCMEPNCGLAFPDNGSLLNHNRIRHEPIEDRPHACHLCNKRFVIASVLRRHLSQHTGVGIYKCDECDENFKHSYQLQAHVVSVHPRI